MPSLKREKTGRGSVPPASPGATRDALDRIVASVPALRAAGLDGAADSIVAMARDARRELERADSTSRPTTRPRSRSSRGRPAAAPSARRYARLRHVYRQVRHPSARRREVLLCAALVPIASLLAGWLITRLS